MSITILTKNSVATGVVPTLSQGELAVNLADKLLYVGPIGDGIGITLNKAVDIPYDDAGSSLTTDNVQAALDELTGIVDNLTGTIIPSGTNMVFYQPTAPTGWTQLTTGTLNDAAFRVVTGTGGGTGGSQLFSVVFQGGLTTGGAGAHSHTYSGTVDVPTTGFSDAGSSSRDYAHSDHVHDYSGTTDPEANHNHALTMDVKFVDVIIASRD